MAGSSEQEIQIPFCTYAWQMIGMTISEPAMLIFDGEQLKLITENEKNGFAGHFSEVKNITFPWYYFGGGFKCEIKNQKFRVSLVKPNGGAYLSTKASFRIRDLLKTAGKKGFESLDAAGVIGAIATTHEAATSIVEGRKNLRKWKTIFAVNFKN